MTSLVGGGVASAQAPDASSAELRVFERLLSTMGFDPGPIDGVFDEDALAALEAFRRADPKAAAIEAEEGLMRALLDANARRPRQPAAAPRPAPAAAPPPAVAFVAPEILAPDHLFARVAPAIMRVRAYPRHPALAPRQRISTGSAVAVSATVALTNCHVVGASEHVFLRAADGRIRRAALVAADPMADACVLALREGADFAAVAMRGRGDRLRVGEQVFAVGAPQGLDATLSSGLISGLRRRGGRVWVQTDAAISRGSSGGGLFDRRGRLIGVTTLFVEEGQNLNFALPLEAFDRLLRRDGVAGDVVLR